MKSSAPKNDQLEASNVDLKDFRIQMNQIVLRLHAELNSIRGGRLTAEVLDPIWVNSYGSKSQLKLLGQISVRGGQTLVVAVHDTSIIKDIVQAIVDAKMDLTPTIEGKTIVVTFPKNTKETREKLVVVAKKKAEDAKVSIRRVRQKAIDNVKKSEGFTKDDHFQAEKDVQKLHDFFVDKVKQMATAKEEEIMTI